ncbi:MAG: hypothetical protein GY853_07160 [PVC group bacterium]|nr:hypothetical protein [PVC group bacterium]
MAKQISSERKVQYCMQDDGKFVITNYDLAKPFASFFPGIAGLFGVPMWGFYVNRGQGVVSFGTKNKNRSILEFFPANKAWQLVSTHGFRTFLKIKNGNGVVCYEPFRNTLDNSDFKIERRMCVTPYDLSLIENNKTLGLCVKVNYFTLSNEPLACLIRKVTVKNTSNCKKTVEIIDGLPQIIPYSLGNQFLKELGRTMEAWMKVDSVTKYEVPYYKLAVDPTDRPQVVYIKGGNFYYNFIEKKSSRKQSEFIVDPEEIFGPVKDFTFPQSFYEKGFKRAAFQAKRNKTPSAFGYGKISLNAKEDFSMDSLTGYAQDEKHLRNLIQKAQSKDFLKKKYDENRMTQERLQHNLFTISDDVIYNCYCEQTYLDNVLRGGYPLSIKAKDKSFIFHVYSRKHGDLERDYNNFLTEPTYFSQGNGNFRDVNQNQRNDVWFNTQVKENNVVKFFNLLQLDGFNPLVVIGTRFKLRSEKIFEEHASVFKKKSDFQKVVDFAKKDFVPGGLFGFLDENNIHLAISNEKFLETLLSCCEQKANAEHGDGFWVDHWTYNMDALESYLAIYPEGLADLLLKRKTFVFFNNFVKVKPRDEKYVLFEGSVRQYRSVSMEEMQEDSHISHTIKKDDWRVRTEYGKGSVYKTTLLVKIICLVANKMASFDPFGCGIEMEANKPGWYDSLNGLPGLFGSSTCETMELKRLISFVCESLDSLKVEDKNSLVIPEEIYDFFIGVENFVDAYLKSKKVTRDSIFRTKTYTLKEMYRKKIHDGLSGTEQRLSVGTLKSMLRKMEQKVAWGVKKAKDKKSGLFHTYFINEVTDYEKIKNPQGSGFKTSQDGLFCVRPKKFKQVPLPLFLEGQVHALRIAEKKDSTKKLYQNTKKSLLYDKALQMYKVNAPLKRMSEEIGRARIFTPGWLENESIWLHMEYKFILELLRNGLYDEFFAEFKKVLIPYQPAARYGRSVLENSSFIVSSAYPDKRLHGNGFVARLSGSTAEFVNMWLWMNVGLNPFRLNKDKKLELEFSPILPAWMFTKKDCSCKYYPKKGKAKTVNLGKNDYAFSFLGTTLVIYHNPTRKDTFGKNGVQVKKIKLIGSDGKIVTLDSPIIPSPYAEQIRQLQYAKIEIDLG